MCMEAQKTYIGRVTLISQNLYNYRKKNRKGKTQIGDYKKNYPAEIYAFQEYPDWGRGRTFFTAFDIRGEVCTETVEETKKIWQEHFPWQEFTQRFWCETSIVFENREIYLINLHISSYTDQLRLLLLKRLEQLKGQMVILMGDFNAAFDSQTENSVRSNEIFLQMIVDRKYAEVMGKGETREKPHYTYIQDNKKTGYKSRKKLDHIFISEKLREKGWKISMEYIDEVNINWKGEDGDKSKAFTDHSGLKLTLECEEEKTGR